MRSLLGQLVLRVQIDLAKIVVRKSLSRDGLSDLEILIILLEDRRFFQHGGIDIFSIARELFNICTFQKFGGASTLDMQFVRMRTGYKDRTLGRKIYEMLLARLLQSRMGKKEIMRAYLHEMFLGTGIYGIEAGANVMFRKSSSELGVEEAAVIAAMMVYPRPLNPPAIWEARVRQRATYGLKLFSEFGRRYKQRPG
jgi:membrane peptidoglycan carboxypeptidase